MKWKISGVGCCSTTAELYKEGKMGASYINREKIVSSSCGGNSVSNAFSHGQNLKQVNKVNLKLFCY